MRAYHGAPGSEHDHGANNRADQSRPFANTIPANRLAEDGCHQGSDDAEDRGKDETCRLVPSQQNELRDNPGDEADADGPDDAHRPLPLMWGVVKNWLRFLTYGF